MPITHRVKGRIPRSQALAARDIGSSQWTARSIRLCFKTVIRVCRIRLLRDALLVIRHLSGSDSCTAPVGDRRAMRLEHHRSARRKNLLVIPLQGRIYIYKRLSIKNFRGIQAGNAHECSLKSHIGRVSLFLSCVHSAQRYLIGRTLLSRREGPRLFDVPSVWQRWDLAVAASGSNPMRQAQHRFLQPP
jgi:hypothetical protein